MKAIIKKILNFLASYILVSKKFKARKGEVVILMYHGVINSQPDIPDWCLVQKENFEKQIKFLSQHFNIISLLDAYSGLKNATIEGPTAVITFDDGYQNNHDIAWPILEKYKAPATVFISTNLIDSNSSIWTARLQDAFGKTNRQEISWRNRSYNLSSKIAKSNSLNEIKRDLKKEHVSIIESEANKLIKELNHQNNTTLSIDSPYRMMTREMISDMNQSELIDFGAHTENHPILSQLSPDEQSKEILNSVKKTSEITLEPCQTFAYPNGQKTDYSKDTIEILQKQDLKLSLTTEMGINTQKTPQFELLRYGVGNEANFQQELLSMYTRYK